MYFDEKNRKQTLFFLLSLIATISIFHAWALNSYFYWVYPWFDIMMHFLGGFWATATFLWLYFAWGEFKGRSIDKKKVFFISLIVFFVAAISWEVFEIFIEATHKQPNFITDTTGDLVLGVLGAGVAYRHFVFNFTKKEDE